MSDDTKAKPEMKRRDFLASASMGLTLMAFGLPNPALAGLSKLEKAPKGSKIASLGIYPPIGISRVGSSPIQEAFLAPEVPGVAPNPNGGFKDGNHRIKKQVQRFFIYAFDKKGRVVREITANEANIEWTVHVANTKAAWYGFNNPLNLGKEAPGIPAPLRNSAITSNAEREKMLIIDPGPVSISGKNANASGGTQKYCLVGSFWKPKHAVKLGEVQTDADGRLKVVAADGQSSSVIPDNPIKDFTKNDAWYDDWCDGWVKATVQLPGMKKPLEAAPAWVACCGPNFAPEIPPFTSMYDTISNTMVQKYENMDPANKNKNKVKRPSLPLSFSHDIYPIFHRLGLMQWVSSAALMQQGWIDVGNFADVNYIKKLANKQDRQQRKKVFEAFRNPHSKVEQQFRLPYMLGSGVDYTGSPEHWLLMPELQYWTLQQWEQGNYVDDFQAFLDKKATETTDKTIHDLPLQEQPDALTQAALEPLSGGNFHPGVELTWVLGQPQLFDDAHPFRIALGDRCSLIQDLGRLITPENAFPPHDLKANKTVECETGATPKKHQEKAADRYPIGPQMPGDLTRWMGLPWQPDAFSCQNVNYANDFPTVVWWPALLPVDILPESSYQQVLRTDLSREERLKFANTRAAWARGAAGIGYHANASYFDGLNRMVYLWERMGMVEKRRTPKELTQGPNALPEELFVEMNRGSMDLELNAPPYLGLPDKPPKR